MCAKVSKKTSAASARKPNPFETVVMKTKHAVLNRSAQSKRPAQLQRQGYERRKQTPGKKFSLMHKTNLFMDARTNGKYVRQQSRKEQAKEMYNLNLTHGGQTMEENENFDDIPDGADDDNEEEDGVLQDDFTSATHFGGGSVNEARPGKDRRTVIEEMIAESMRVKMERQRENDEIYEMRLNLDNQLKSLMGTFIKHIRKDTERLKPDSYDRLLREMVFERRGVPTEKLKAFDRVTGWEKRERMERDAQRVVGGASRPISADALSDEYLKEENIEKQHMEEEETYVGERGNGDAERDDSKKEEHEDLKGKSESSDADSLSDLQVAFHHESEEELESDQEPESKPVKTKQANKRKPAEQKPTTFELRMIDVPGEYEQFAEQLEACATVHDRIGVIASMVHTLKQKPFLHKSRWSVLFAYALHYLDVRFTRASSATIEEEFRTMDLLTPLLHDMAQMDPPGIGKVYQSVLQEKYAEFRNHSRPRYPDLPTVALLKLVPLLFSASDRRHSIVTPALVFIGEILARCHVYHRRDVARGLLLVTTLLECVEHSKRFVPSAVAFLVGLLDQACPKELALNGQPFKLSNGLLLTETDDLCSDETNSLTAQDLLLTQITPSFKVRAINSSIVLVAALCNQQSKSNPAVTILAKHFLRPLTGIHKDTPNLPPTVRTVLEQTITHLTELSNRSLPYLVQAARKPKPLRLLEPKINPAYEDIRRRPKTVIPLREQRRKLQQKIKKVTRCVKREIRLDNEYIAKLQHKRRMKGDRERQQKVRQILSYASSQQAELNSLDRMAK